jgi:hypothetical protein
LVGEERRGVERRGEERRGEERRERERVMEAGSEGRNRVVEAESREGKRQKKRCFFLQWRHGGADGGSAR